MGEAGVDMKCDGGEGTGENELPSRADDTSLSLVAAARASSSMLPTLRSSATSGTKVSSPST